jgi:DNA polymerase-3 subunit gamma/tau
MYQVLARKYRPRNFSQLVGQAHVSRALSSALERGRLHHAYLFTGTRGVGKTTIARILAKCLNCETGITATPCESCHICQSVNEGRFIDLIEIDAASRTRVEDTRELLDNVPYAPTQGRYKVYLIDEVHMLSTHSFNALLKTLEEPPEHVKFLFATTDPQKLPITVISRCLQFTLRPLAKDEIVQHLQQILTTEQIEHDSAALWQLAESAQGSMRDALSLTDQAIAYGQGQIHSQDVHQMLGLVDQHLVQALMMAIHQDQRAEVAQLIYDMRQQAIDVAHVLEQLISMLHEVAVLQCFSVGSRQELSPEQQRYEQLAQQIAAQDLQLYYQIALQGFRDVCITAVGFSSLGASRGAIGNKQQSRAKSAS